jgi:hypothetical protein
MQLLRITRHVALTTLPPCGGSCTSPWTGFQPRQLQVTVLLLPARAGDGGARSAVVVRRDAVGQATLGTKAPAARRTRVRAAGLLLLRERDVVHGQTVRVAVLGAFTIPTSISHHIRIPPTITILPKHPAAAAASEQARHGVVADVDPGQGVRGPGQGFKVPKA